MTQDHTVKAFDDELDVLKSDIMRMGGLVEAQLALAVEALAKRDTALARKIIAADQIIDDLETDVQEQAVKVLALRQPLANDLRRVVSTFKISGELERMGDHAVNIAKRIIPLAQAAPLRSFGTIVRMARLVQEITKETLDAFAADDPDRAREAWLRDEDVDDLYTSLFRELLTYMMEDPRTISHCTHLLFVAKNVERIGDHTTNLAEAIIYSATGERLEINRPHADRDEFYHLAAVETGIAPGAAPSSPPGLAE